MIAWLKTLFSSGEGVKGVLTGAGELAKDIKTIATGKIDPEKQLELLTKIQEIENSLSQIQSTVINAESQGNFLQRSWRPISMLSFLVLVIFNQFGLLVIPLSGEIWDLFKIGLGGYVGGRSLEKVITTLKK